MRVSRRVTAVAISVLTIICWSFSLSAVAQPSDQAVAERVLGSGWQQLSRRAGMIFAGTVVSAGRGTRPTDRAAQGTSTVELNFLVDEPIAGVERGETLKIHEWLGAWSMHRPMLPGQRFLIFLYPLSRLGLTSPVGGSNGQVALDSSGKNVSYRHFSELQKANAGALGSVSVLQLERAIRGARLE
jgi:hypothetical protein